MEYFHKPVLKEEIVALFKEAAPDVFVDATLGGGGHSEAVLKALPKTQVIGIDQDREAQEAAQKRLGTFGNRFKPLKGNFSNLAELLENAGIKKIDGILFDLGVSSYQIDAPSRGFSLQKDGPLDMRMDQSASNNAAKIVNNWPEKDLMNIFFEFGEERFSRQIARAIVKARAENPIQTTGELRAIIERATAGWKKIDTVTRIFQALRIAVNNELGVLQKALKEAIDRLSPGGIIAVISYHSLEDRIVKNLFREEAKDCLCPPRQLKCLCNHKARLEILTKKPTAASEAEIEVNSRARSAKLRVAKKI